jgi:hypothetical protein
MLVAEMVLWHGVASLEGDSYQAVSVLYFSTCLVYRHRKMCSSNFMCK